MAAPYRTGLYGVQTSKTGQLILVNSHVSFINMSYKSFNISKLEFEIINLNYNKSCLKIIIS